ncbi:MAG: Uma2 family endonuclease [Lacipirellulaceae bacterium]
MTALEETTLLSVEEYLAREEEADVRHEYLGGYVYAMAGSKNSHTLISTDLLVALGLALRGKPCQPWNSDAKVRVRLPTHTRFYYPDVMVVCDPNPGSDTFHDRPVVLVEVLSDSTRRTDEFEKREAYLTIPTLKAYLLVEQDSAAVRVYRRAGDDFAVEWHAGLDSVVPLPEVGVELALRDVYARIDFTAAPAAEEA